MNITRPLIFSVFLFLIIGSPLSSWAMSGEQALRLKQAGVSDASIQMMIHEKSIETVSLTVEEVLEMKAAGIDEATLQILIQSLSFMKNNRPIVYGTMGQDLPLTSAKDLLQLKKAGFSDETLRAIVTLASGDTGRDGYEDALRILESMNIWVSPHPHHRIHTP